MREIYKTRGEFNNITHQLSTRHLPPKVENEMLHKRRQLQEALAIMSKHSAALSLKINNVKGANKNKGNKGHHKGGNNKGYINKDPEIQEVYSTVTLPSGMTVILPMKSRYKGENK